MNIIDYAMWIIKLKYLCIIVALGFVIFSASVMLAMWIIKKFRG